MKTLIILLTILAMPVMAQKRTDLETCEIIGGFAGSTMKARQENVSAIKAYRSANNDPMLLLIVEEAYNTPAYVTDAYKSRAIVSHENKWFMQCMKMMKSDKA